MNSTEPINDLEVLKEQLKNKQKIRLLFPYEKNQELKKLGVKYNSVDKIWYFPSINGELPDELKQYKAHKIFMEYDEKEYYKPVLKSMRFDKISKFWYCNQEDFNTFLRLKGDNV